MTTGVSAASWLQASAPRRGNVSGKSSGNGSFSDMISSSLSAQNKKTVGSQPQGNAPTNDAVQKNTDTANQVEPGKDGKPDGVKNQEEMPNTGEEKLVETEMQDCAGTELKTLIKGVLNDIRKAVMETLGLTEEELVRAMEQLGMCMMDLMSTPQLQQLVLAVSGETDTSAFLIDSNLAGKFSELVNKVQEIFEQAGTTPQELTSLLKEQPEFAELLTQELSVAEQPENKPVVAEDNKAVKDNESTLEKESTFQFEAVKETGKDNAGTRQEAGRQDNRADTSVSQADQFLNLVSSAAQGDDVQVEFERVDVAAQIREIADQILEKVRVVISPTKTSMEITLTPESLGKVSLNIISQHGAMTARFTAQTELARQAIESQLVTLRENLEKQGLKVDAIEVTVSDFGFSQRDGASSGQPQGGRQQRRNISIENAGVLGGTNEEEEIAPNMMVQSGNQVDYTA